jgi:RNA polymerase sigma-70 factor (sigma-E family)
MVGRPEEQVMAIRSQADAAAFSDLVTARSPALLRTAYLVVGDHQLAQDLLQEALVKVYVAWPRLRDVTKAEAYVRRTIVTTAISWRRRRSFHERPIDAFPDVYDSDQAERLAAHDVMWKHVCSLPPKQRAALVLRYYEDLSEADTAEALGCSVGTVKSQVSEALGKLRTRVGPEFAATFPNDEAVTG